MSFTAILLRLLLCLGLLANGSAQAVASAPSAAAVDAPSVATPPCHEADDAKAPMANRPMFHLAGKRATKRPDCCNSGSGDCTCSHGVTATLPFIGGVARHIADLTLFEPPPEQYASPALPRRVRPPIV